MDWQALLNDSLMEALSGTLFHFLWQGALAALLLGAALLLLRGRSAAVRYAACCAAMALMALAAGSTFWVLWTAEPIPQAPSQVSRGNPFLGQVSRGNPFLVSRSNPWQVSQAADFRRQAQSGSRRTESTEMGSLLEGFSAWRRELVAVWLAGVLFFSLRLLGGWVQANRLRGRRTSALPERLQIRLSNLCGRMKIPAAVRFLRSAAVRIPMVVGWLRPVVLLPVSALAGLSMAQLEAIAAHELAHIRRRDYLVNLLQRMVETLLFYHPAVWWVSRQIRIEREHCCDDLAVAACRDAIGYARALALLEGMQLGSRASAVSLAADGSPLLERVRRLVAPDRPAPAGLSGPLAAGAVLGLISAGLLATSFPQSAQTEKPVKRLLIGPAELTMKPAEPVQLISPQSVALAPAAELQLEQRTSLQAVPSQLKAKPASTGAFISPQAVRLSPAAVRLQKVPAALVPPAIRTVAAPLQQSAPPEILPWSERQWGRGKMRRDARNMTNRDVSSFVWTDDDRLMGKWQRGSSTLRVEAAGSVQFGDDDRSLLSLSPDGYLVIEEKRGSAKRRYEAEVQDGSLRRRVYQNRQAAGMGTVEEWAAQAFLAVIRRTGIGAEQRLQRILQDEGLEGVLREIDQSGSDHVRRIYFRSLIRDGQLDAGQLSTVVAKIGQSIEGDGDKTRLLIEVSDLYADDPQLTRAFLEASRTVSSDGDRRRLLAELLERPGLDDSMGLAALQSIGEIRSDGDKAALLMHSATRFAVAEGPAMRSYFQALEGISSDGDQSRVLIHLMRQEELGREAQGQLLRSTRQISSDGDLARVLVRFASRYEIGEELGSDFFRAVDGISSSGDRARVLTQLSGQEDLPKGVVLGLLESASEISSDGDLARVLVSTASLCRGDDELLQAYRRTARTISSQGDYQRAMRAVGEGVR